MSDSTCPLVSMTGFGRAEISLDGLAVVLELKSVNRKNLDLHFNLPREWQPLEIPFRQKINESLSRGRLDLELRCTKEGEETFLDSRALEREVSVLQSICGELGIDPTLSPSDLIQLQQASLRSGVPALTPDLEAGLIKMLDTALGQLIQMRLTEGMALLPWFEESIQGLETTLEALATFAGQIPALARDRFYQRLQASGLEFDLDDDRVLKEIALLAEKADVSEEITRLRSHFKQFRKFLHEEGAVGRRLDFLCQEMSREINTLGSKAGSAEMSPLVIRFKNDLEKIREQAMNIE